MQNLTPTGQNVVNDLSFRYNLSQDAVIHMLIAVNQGGGTMAQFNVPELGGCGQWMRGGMTMVGDMFNYGLKQTVDNLCGELSSALAQYQIFPPAPPPGTPGSNAWWPSELGQPFSSGAQNQTRYAIFPGRLAVDYNGTVTVYDTLDHQIGGVSQQQGGLEALTFSSQYGTLSVSSLPVISGPGSTGGMQNNFAAPPAFVPESVATPPVMNDAAPSGSSDMLALIEKLASLRDAGILSEQEFSQKKADLLNRL